jgi:hypothetical protein
MKIFQNKTPRSWKSSGVLAKGSQIEMSNFSFLEEFVKTSEGKFSINIIGKNIIGNGLFSIQIYKEEFLVWKESFNFKNISFSKKTIDIEEESNQEFKIVISRGKDSKGKILIDSVSVLECSPKQDLLPEKKLVLEIEDQPTFYIPESIEMPIETKKEELIIEPNLESNIISTELVANKQSEEAVTKTKIKVQRQKRTNIKKNKKIEEPTAVLEEQIIKVGESDNKEIFIEPEVQVKVKNDIWIHILDLSLITEEREIFKYINQISFGKGKQTFLVKNNPEINLLKYEHVIICESDENIITKLVDLNPNKITYSETNLTPKLLESVKRIKEEL